MSSPSAYAFAAEPRRQGGAVRQRVVHSASSHGRPASGRLAHDRLVTETAPGSLDPTPSPALPVGRETEVDRVLRVVDGRDGLPQALLILGEVGTGKSQMFDLAQQTAAAHGTRVLSAHGWAGESRQPFAALHQLLGPVLADLDKLPDHHRRVLRGVFGFAGESGLRPAAAALRLALLALVDRLAQERPLLLAVDGIQDCDEDSMNALFFVARRLTDQRVSVLLTARGETPPSEAPEDLQVLPLGPLRPIAAARLLDAQPGAPRGRARLDVLEQAGGNPLAIIELWRAADRTKDAEGLGVTLDRPLNMQRMFGARLSALPEATRRALLYAASAHRRENLTTVMTALGTSDLRVWAPAEVLGLVTVARGRPTLRNPLIRAAVRLAHPVSERQQAHRDLAAASHLDPALRAWHLAAAAVGSDEQVAAALEDAADRTEHDETYFEVARTLEHAAHLTPDNRDRARRLAKALIAASDAGDPEWVRDLYADFTAVGGDSELLCVAACAAGAALSQFSFQRQAFDLLLQAWQRTPPRSVATATAMAAVAMGIADRSGLPEHQAQLPALLDRAAEIARKASDGQTQDEGPLAAFAEDDVLSSLRALASAGTQHETAAVGVTLRGPDRPSGAIGLITAASVAYHSDESDLFVHQYRRLSDLLQAREAVGLHAWILPAQVDTLLALGRWKQAEALIDQGRSDAAVHRLMPLALELDALAATLRALRGDSGQDAPFSGPGRVDVNLDENRSTHARILRSQGLAAMARGDAEIAFRALRSLFAHDGTPLHPFLSPRCVADLAAAAQRIGRQQEAAAVLRAIQEAPGFRPTPRMTLLAHHAAALVEEDAEYHFRLALADPRADAWLLERAQARLHYAIWLRRDRRPREARPELAMVLETARRLGVRHLESSALGELRATGVAGLPAPTEALPDLTPQQLQVARMAADGLSNREIGEHLFLSPRTVGSHLHTIFPKLGISRRHQLRDILNGR